MEKRSNINPSNYIGIFAPVFTCFNNDPETSLNLQHIDTYARWLKDHRIKGILVNAINGEGPALGLTERKLNAEAWNEACKKFGLLMLLQVGGAPLPDVLHLAAHASTLNIAGIVCMPELFYKPSSIENLVGYCKIIASRCANHPFFYYHIPRYTGLYFDMEEFCPKAEKAIPNFLGLEFSHYDILMGSRCMSRNRVILLGDGRLLASGMLLGFKSGIMTSVNMVPDLLYDIYDAMERSDLRAARRLQKTLNTLIKYYTSSFSREGWTASMKNWFNDQMLSSADFTAGPTRKFF